MKDFIDNNNRKWSISINIASVKRVREKLDINLNEAVGGKLIEMLSSDPEQLCNVIYVLVQPQADKDGISDIQFGEGMGGDAIDRATEAFIDELINFFPAARRGVIRNVTAKYKVMEQQAMETLQAYIDGPELTQKFADKLNATIASAGN